MGSNKSSACWANGRAELWDSSERMGGYNNNKKSLGTLKKRVTKKVLGKGRHWGVWPELSEESHEKRPCEAKLEMVEDERVPSSFCAAEESRFSGDSWSLPPTEIPFSRVIWAESRTRAWGGRSDRHLERISQRFARDVGRELTQWCMWQRRSFGSLKIQRHCWVSPPRRSQWREGGCICREKQCQSVRR